MTLHELVLAELQVKVTAEGLPALSVRHAASVRHEQERDGALELSIEVGKELERSTGLGKHMVALLQHAVDVEGEGEGRRDWDRRRGGGGCRLASRVLPHSFGLSKSMRKGKERGQGGGGGKAPTTSGEGHTCRTSRCATAHSLLRNRTPAGTRGRRRTLGSVRRDSVAILRESPVDV